VNVEKIGNDLFGYFNETELPQGVKIDLESWLARQAAQNSLPPAPTPPAPPQPEPTQAVEDEPQISMADIEAANRADIRQRNAALFEKHEAEQRAAKEAAEKAEQARIAAEKATAALAAAAAEKARLAALPRLPNGELQLPLDTVPSFKHSKEQLRDLAARQRETARSGPRAHGWRGSKF
jgi:hypothetical protein